MKHDLPMLALTLALVALMGIANPARAQDGAGDATRLALQARAVADLDTLDAQRGGADQALSTIRAGGTVSEVGVSDVLTGHNVVTEGALAGASGVPMLIQNSGNGVLIQNAVILNVQMQ
ncbi:MAG: hypothetical protein QM639_20685 [Rhodocyclaceae bacterium]